MFVTWKGKGFERNPKMQCFYSLGLFLFTLTLNKCYLGASPCSNSQRNPFPVVTFLKLLIIIGHPPKS